MAELVDLTRNYSFYAIPVAWVLAIFPHGISLSLGKSIDKTAPRTYGECIANDQTLDKATKAMIHRCEGAQKNGFENLGLFAAAVVAGNLAGLPAETLNVLSGGYLASRVLYNLIYVTHTSEIMANVRSLTYFSGIGMIMALFIKSGNILSETTHRI
ncbi:hypothetical protein OIDMADRAFT_19570 [Oidiodendron maius Zn]|uniref:MAPEG family protein n=1 Tax=Oidiodendron maius (strain Zn) TaxID=913774 RepID=A0A0C3DEY4_OIDMZ|nr:hypothetical protein OIDMADRAFT_19570 [Oidiodendron maius Zn]